MSMETLSYMGLPNCIQLSNGSVELIVTTAVGPRVLFYGPAGGENLLGQFPALSKDTALGTWKPYGGHRLWVRPEIVPATYAPDNGPVAYEADGQLGIVLRQPTDAAGMQKEIRLKLAPTGTEVALEHTITSHCLWPVEIAAWAITVVRTGTAIVPRVPFKSHDEDATVAQPLTLCTYTDLQDPRFLLGLKYILLSADPALPNSQKFGLRNKQGWCAHLVGNSLFVKRFAYDERAVYPDYGVNTEIYVEGSFMEVELLGPQRTVVPGGSVSISEKWNLFEDLEITSGEKDIEAIDRAITPRIRPLLGDVGC